jgi:endoglucanase
MRRVSHWLGSAFLALSMAACITSGPEPASPAPAAAAAKSSSTAVSSSSVESTAKFCAKGHSEDVLLEDMEDNDNRILVKDGRGGYWFSFRDDKGSTLTPDSDSQTSWCKPPPSKIFPMAEGGAGGSKHSARFQGKLIKSDGQWAGVGLGIADDKGSCAFDASKYKGVSFMAKGPAKVRVRVPDVNNAPEGNVCKKCYNDFGVDIDLTAEWKEYTIPFESMTQQRGRGEEVPHIAVEKIYGIMWMAYAAGAEFDVRIDNVKLVGCP